MGSSGAQEAPLLLKLILKLAHPLRGPRRVWELPGKPGLAAPEPPPTPPRVSPQSVPP